MTPETCAEHAETFWTLFKDAAHWEFELFLVLVFDGLVGAIAWPLAKRYWARHHRHDEQCGEAAKVPAAEPAPKGPEYLKVGLLSATLRCTCSHRLYQHLDNSKHCARCSCTLFQFETSEIAPEPEAGNPTCSDGHPGCRGDDPFVPGGGTCTCPNVMGMHGRRTSCPPREWSPTISADEVAALADALERILNRVHQDYSGTKADPSTLIAMEVAAQQMLRAAEREEANYDWSAISFRATYNSSHRTVRLRPCRAEKFWLRPNPSPEQLGRAEELLRRVAKTQDQKASRTASS